VIANITLRGRTPKDRKERDLDLFPAEGSEDDREWIGLSIRQPNTAEPFGTIWVLRRDLVSALSALAQAEDRTAAERIDWVVEQVRQRRLSYGKAAELLGVPKARFIQMLGQREVSSVDLDEKELAGEVRAAEEIAGR
jgi:predicted HTH domain antitoxin